MAKSNAIITLGVGGAGVSIASAMLQQLATDIGGTQPDADGVFFHKLGGGALSPWAVLVDTDPLAGGRARERLLGQPGALGYRTDAIVVGREGAARCFSRAYCDAIDTKLSTVLDQVRRIRDSVRVDGFLIVHALAGGTGSGLAARLVEMLKSHYPKIARVSAALLPDRAVHPSPLDALNAGLALHKLADSVDLCLLADNDALSQHARRGGDAARDAVLASALANFALVLQDGRASLPEITNHLGAITPRPFVLMSRLYEKTSASKQLASALEGRGALATAPSRAWQRPPLAAMAVWRGGFTQAERDAAAALLDGRALKPAPSLLPYFFKQQEGVNPRAQYLYAAHAGVARVLASRVEAPFRQLVDAGAFTDGYGRDGLAAATWGDAKTTLAALVSQLDGLSAP